MKTFYAPDSVWNYLADCSAAQQILPIDAEFLQTVVTVNGIEKPFGRLAADDFEALGRAERQRITTVTLARLDAIDRGRQ